MNSFRAKLNHLIVFPQLALLRPVLVTQLSSEIPPKKGPRFSGQNNSLYRWYPIRPPVGDTALLTFILRFTGVSCSFSLPFFTQGTVPSHTPWEAPSTLTDL